MDAREVEMGGLGDEEDAKYRDEELGGQQRHPNEEEEEPVILVDNVHKTYLLGVEGVPALRGVSLSVGRGEFICILGKSGGGKTSMLNIIGTIDKPTKGELFICGRRITSKTTDKEFASLRLRNLGFVFQTFNLISSMTAQENVELPMILDGRLSRGERRRRAVELLESVGMGERLDHLPSQLSGGEQQRVTAARALANRPDVLLLDEPTGDLDTANSNTMMRLLLDLNRNERITLVMVTHDRSLKFFAHRVVHMLDGKIARVETVPAERRRQAEQELADAMDNPVRAAVVEETEVRDPFAFYRFDGPQHQHQQQQQQQPAASVVHEL